MADLATGTIPAPLTLDTAVRVRRTESPPIIIASPVRRRPSRDMVLVGSLIVLAAVLRLPTLNRAYWVDEGISVGIASHRLSQIPGLLRLDGSPPLFYAVLHFWLRLFGGSQISTHTLSLLVSLLLVPVAWWSAMTLFGRRTTALCAAALVATNPFLNWYGTETRMYPLVCGLSIVAVTLAVRAVQRRRLRDGVLAALTFVVLLYTHNWALYVVAATAGVLVIRAAWRRDWRQAGIVTGATVCVALAYLPWLPHFLDQAAHTGAPWAVSPSLGDLFADPASVVGGTLGAVVLPLLFVGVLVTWFFRTTEENMTFALVAAIGLSTVAGGWIVAQIDPTWTSRYLAVALGPVLIATAGALGPSSLGRRILAAAVVPMAAWSVIGSLLPDHNAQYAKSNVAAVAAAARPWLHPGDLIIVTQTEQLAVLSHYLPAGLGYATPTGPVEDPRVVNWRDLVKRLSSSDPCRTVAPEIEAVPAGGHILVVNPYKHLGASGTTWSRTVNAKVAAVNAMVSANRGLTEVGPLAPATQPKPYSAVTGMLFTRNTGPAACP